MIRSVYSCLRSQNVRFYIEIPPARRPITIGGQVDLDKPSKDLKPVCEQENRLKNLNKQPIKMGSDAHEKYKHPQTHNTNNKN